MLQICAFENDDFDTAYDLANAFIARLASLGIHVQPEDIKENTKNYPDYGRSHTVVSIYPNIRPERASEIRSLRLIVIKEAREADEAAQRRMQVAREIEQAGKLLFQHRDEWCVSARDNDQWAVIDLKTNEVLIPAMPADQVLGSVQKFLKERFPEIHGDDFDPFIDPDDLP